MKPLHTGSPGDFIPVTAYPAPIPVDRQAEALADIKRMHDELMLARTDIGQLKADLNREHDRVDMIVEERDRHRRDALTFRKLLIELSVQMTNIGLLTVKAQEIAKTVADLDAAETPPTEAVDRLEAAFKNGGAP